MSLNLTPVQWIAVFGSVMYAVAHAWVVWKSAQGEYPMVGFAWVVVVGLTETLGLVMLLAGGVLAWFSAALWMVVGVAAVPMAIQVQARRIRLIAAIDPPRDNRRIQHLYVLDDRIEQSIRQLTAATPGASELVQQQQRRRRSTHG